MRYRSLAFLLILGSVGVWFTNSNAEVISPQTLMEEGNRFYQQGRFDQAARSWTHAAKSYENSGDHPNHIQALIYLSRALLDMGQNRQAQQLLRTAIQKAQETTQPRLMAQALSQLGTLHLNVGEPDSALEILQQGLKVSRDIEDQPLIAATLNDLGNAHAVLRNDTEAIAAYTESSILADSLNLHPLSIRAMINAALVEIKQQSPHNGKLHLQQALEKTRQLPDSHEKIQNLLTIGMGLKDLSHQVLEEHATVFTQAAESFQEAIGSAKEIGDWRNESYGWGFLGELYEEEGRHEEALRLTQLATRASQQGQAPESLYRWEWNTGRHLKSLGRNDEAILAYQRAIDTLQPIRQQIAVGLPQNPASFRESLGALFFETAALLLQLADEAPDATRQEELLFQTRDTIEALKAAELQDYFKDDCVEANKGRIQAIDKVSTTTAIIYPILFPDRMTVLMGLGGTMKKVAVPVQERDLAEKIHLFRTLLEKRTTHQYLPHAQSLYDLLIRPLEPYLNEFGIQTLVFVPDGSLRTIPMGSLHDGEKFLIQKYALAITPGITLTDAHPLNREQVNLLSIGLSEGVQGFSPLPNTQQEVKGLENLFGGKTLLNEEFRIPNLEQDMKEENFTIIHIASHGKFENEAKDSFVLTYDNKLTMDRLRELIGLFQFRQIPLDLLTLSACETAGGDDRSALGLAGVAVKAGARSALATLWFINDQASSDLINEFYVRLKKSSLSKAQALREAQMTLLDHPIYRHPSYWAPFLLINNWL
ncbi:MAG: CHAT domain-containing protein [Nitrospirales bacterium]|nr:CHAT domain-containing protein [Nitrospirales bacterium]MDR4485287.1 CHAT domain-containing protein [Nitrospirales bacterium]